MLFVATKVESYVGYLAICVVVAAAVLLPWYADPVTYKKCEVKCVTCYDGKLLMSRNARFGRS